MKSNSVVLFYRTGRNQAPSSVDTTEAVASMKPRVNSASRSGSAPAGEKRGLAGLHNDWPEGQFWEAVIFGTLGICGAATMVLALLRIAGGH